jgi:hypothetical protein
MDALDAPVAVHAVDEPFDVKLRGGDAMSLFDRRPRVHFMRRAVSK